jgi:hypothetical protein
MSVSVALVLGGLAAAVSALWYGKGASRRRAAYISGYQFPEAIEKKLGYYYPHLTEEQRALVLQGLREYFQVCNRAGRRRVSMPSQAVDQAWHQFILFTRAYRQFCNKALGRFLHHTPAEAMSSRTVAQAGIKRAWRIACRREGIDPRTPARLPLLFAIDGLLNIPDGFRYSLNCQGLGASGYCAAHIGCASGCAGDAASEDAGDSAGDGSGCGGGCGGDLSIPRRRTGCGALTGSGLDGPQGRSLRRPAPPSTSRGHCLGLA